MASKPKKLGLRCYCCGQPLAHTFALVTMDQGPVDRVFVMRPECTERADASRIITVEWQG